MSTCVDRCDFKPGDVVNGRYRVEKALGEGSFGKVYRVKDQKERAFALKMLRLWEVTPEIRKQLMGRFEMEFRTGQIDSDYLVRSYHFDEVGGNPFIVMEYCDGGDLVPLLGSPKADVPSIGYQVLMGLRDLHRNGKVHRDLKPENVLFKHNGVAALTDFGIIGDQNNQQTETNIFGKPLQIFGTYAYMSPEQANRSRGRATVLPTTDIWSFGVMLYQLLTGELPFGSLASHNDLSYYLKQSKKGEWDKNRLASVPNSRMWEQVIAHCLVPNFKHRIPSVNDLLDMPVFQNIRKHVFHRPNTSDNNETNNNHYQSMSMRLLRNDRISGYMLHIMQGEDYGQKYSLTDIRRGGCKEITLGRSPENVIYIKETYNIYVSRYHCTIRWEDDTKVWQIFDGRWDSAHRVWNHSTNGTYVNSTQVEEGGYELKVGDIITIGDTKIRLETF